MAHILFQVKGISAKDLELLLSKAERRESVTVKMLRMLKMHGITLVDHAAEFLLLHGSARPAAIFDPCCNYF